MFNNIEFIDVSLSFNVKSFLKVVKKKGKKMILSKNETFFVRFVFYMSFYSSLYGEITLGIMTSIESNAKQILITQNNSVECIPFGVIPLEKMIQNGTNPQECTKSIDEFYKANPHEKVFAKGYLHRQQTYHYEKLQEGCILYANGAESYSEMLLRRGIALIDPNYDNNEWNGRLKKAQEGAKRGKVGLHDTLIQKYCIKEEK